MKIGFIINPFAGIGGKVALKGSDGEQIQELALSLGALKEASSKASIVLEHVLDYAERVHFLTASGEMGEDLLREMGFDYEVVHHIAKEKSSYLDTVTAAQEILGRGADLLVFAGGDGTARDLYGAIRASMPVLGIPAGVKIHSAVYANSLSGAGSALAQYLNDNAQDIVLADVMDIDEEMFRKGMVVAKRYGQMRIPKYERFMQRPKATSVYQPEDLYGIYHELQERIDALPENTLYVWGTGGTIHHVMSLMNIESSLLGVDITERGQTLLLDATERQLLDFLPKRNTKLILSVIGGQGHILGRGNAQISPDVIRAIGVDNIWIVSTMSKIMDLDKHILHVDTPDKDLNRLISGYRRVITGWQKELICQVVD